MGTNSSKVLKRRYERGEYTTLNASKPRQLQQHKVVGIEVRGNRGTRRYECIVQELDTSEYTQTLTKVDDFLEKMNKTSPNISSFFFICSTQAKGNCFDLVFEYGRNDVSAGSLGDGVLQLLRVILEGLRFLDEIKLFYPDLGWSSVLRVGSGFKLINQFCYPDFLQFVTNTLLNVEQNSYSLTRILRQKKRENFGNLCRMLREILGLNSDLNFGHRFSNLGILLKYMELQDPERVQYSEVIKKMEELFDFGLNGNKGYREEKPKAQAHFQIGSRLKHGMGHSRSEVNIRRNIISTPVRKKDSPFGHRKFPSSNTKTIQSNMISFSNQKREPIRTMKSSKTEKNIAFLSRRGEYQNGGLQRVTSDCKLYIRDPKINSSFQHYQDRRNEGFDLTKSSGFKDKQDVGLREKVDVTPPIRKLSNLSQIGQVSRKNTAGGLSSKLSRGNNTGKLGSRNQQSSLKGLLPVENSLTRKGSGLNKQIKRIGLGDRRNLKLNKSAHGSGLTSKLKLGLMKSKKTGLGSKLLRKNSSNNKHKFGNIKKNLIAAKNSPSLKKLRSFKFGQKKSPQGIGFRKLASLKKEEREEEQNEIQHIGQIKPKKNTEDQQKKPNQYGLEAKIGRDTNDTDQTTKAKESRENQIIESQMVIAEVFDEEVEKAVEKINTSKQSEVREDSRQWNIIESEKKPATLGGPITDSQVRDLPPHLKDKYTLTLSEEPGVFQPNPTKQPSALAPPYVRNDISRSQPPRSDFQLRNIENNSLEKNIDVNTARNPSKQKKPVNINPFTRSGSQKYSTNLPDLGVTDPVLTTEKQKDRNSNLTDISQDVFMNRRKTKYSKVIDETLKKELEGEFENQMEILDEHEEIEGRLKKDEIADKKEITPNPEVLDIKDLIEPRGSQKIIQRSSEQRQDLLSFPQKKEETNEQMVKVVRMKWDGKKYQQVTEYQSIRGSIGSRNFSRKNSEKNQPPKIIKSQSKTMQNLGDQDKITEDLMTQNEGIMKVKSFNENIGGDLIRDSLGLGNRKTLRDSIPNKRTSIPINTSRNNNLINQQNDPYQFSEPRTDLNNQKRSLKTIRLEDRVSQPRSSQKNIIIGSQEKIGNEKSVGPGSQRNHSTDKRLDNKKLNLQQTPEAKSKDPKLEELKKFVNTPKKLNPQVFFEKDKNGMINSASTKNIFKSNKLDMKKSHSTYALPEASQSKAETLDHAQAFANITPKLNKPKIEIDNKHNFRNFGRRQTKYFEEAEKNYLARFEDFGRCPENEYRMVVFRMEKRFQADKIFFNNPINFIEPEMRIQVRTETPQSRNNTTGGLIANLKCQHNGSLTTVRPDSLYHDMSQVVLQKKTLKPSVYHDLAALEEDFSFPEDIPKAPREPVFHKISSGAKQIGENTFMVGGIEFKVMKSKNHSKSATNLHSLTGGTTSNVTTVSTHIPLGARRDERSLGNASRLRGGVQYKSSTNLHRVQGYGASGGVSRGNISTNASFTNYSGQTQYRSHNPMSQEKTIGLSAEALRQRNKTRVDLHSGQRYVSNNYGLSSQGR